MQFNTEILIEENDSVRILDEVIEKIYENPEVWKEDYTGKTPQDIMMRILIYGYMEEQYSSRKIEKSCKRDINYKYLLNDYEAPDHSTISRFRKNMSEQIEKVFYELVKYLKNEGEISGENLFIDGTKIEANANRYTFVWKKSVTKNEQRMKEKLAELLKNLEAEHHIKFKETAHPTEIIDTMKKILDSKNIELVYGKGKHKTDLQRYYDKLCEYTEMAVKYDGYNNLFDGRNSFSKTDTDATFMRMKDDHMRNGQLKPGYNIQAGVEGEYIVGIDISSERSDVNTLIPFLKKLSMKNIMTFKNIVADAGYESEENYKYLIANNYETYIKPLNYEILKKKSFKIKLGRVENMRYIDFADVYVCSENCLLQRVGTRHSKSKTGFVSTKAVYKCESCQNCPNKTNCTKAFGDKMLTVSHDFLGLREVSQTNITTPLGKQLRMNRSIQSEGVFGILKQDYSFRRFLTRGKNNVENEFTLLSIAFNIKKLFNKISGNRLGVSLFESKVA
jgi:transposase